MSQSTTTDSDESPRLISQIVDVMRDMGMPPVLTGMIRQMAAGMPDEMLREMCARASVGFIGIYMGMDPREALAYDTITGDQMDAMVQQLTQLRDMRAEIPVVIPEELPVVSPALEVPEAE